MNLNYFPGDNCDVAIVAQNHVAATIVMENDRPGSARAGSASPLSEQLFAGSKPSSVVSRYNSIMAYGDITPWGDDNDFPQRIVELYQKDPIIPQTLGKMAAMLSGRGVMAVQEVLKDGKEADEIITDPEIKAFVDSAMFRKYLRDASMCTTWFFNAWPELIKSKNHKKVVQIHSLNAEECRWSKMTPEGNLPYVYLSADWPHARAEDPTTKRIKAIDPYQYDKVSWTRNQADYNLVYPISYPTPGKRFYSLAHHYSIVRSGWLDVHLAVPAFKKFLMMNQMTIKYHWKVDVEYWPKTFGTLYTEATPEGRREIKRKWLQQMTAQLTNVQNTGNSILTDMTWSREKNQFMDHISVTAVTDAMKDGKYLDDNLEAAANIFYAIGIDPTIVGFAGGEKMGARSGGSDKREAYLIALQMMNPFREMLIEPLDFIAEYNGWKDRYPNLRFRFRDTILTTLDTGAGTEKKLS